MHSLRRENKIFYSIAETSPQSEIPEPQVFILVVVDFFFKNNLYHFTGKEKSKKYEESDHYVLLMPRL